MVKRAETNGAMGSCTTRLGSEECARLVRAHSALPRHKESAGEKNMRKHKVTDDGMYVETTYPIAEHEEGSEFHRIVSAMPDNVLRVYDPITTVDGTTYGKGVVWADESNHGKGGISIVWRLA